MLCTDIIHYGWSQDKTIFFFVAVLKKQWKK